jgi:hypothetical protein
MRHIITYNNTNSQHQFSYNYTIALNRGVRNVLPMKDIRDKIADRQRKILRQHMDRLDLNVSSWAKKAGFTEGALRHFLSGDNNSLGSDKMEMLANAIGLTLSEMLSENKQPMVYVVGYVGAGAEIYPYDDHAQGAGLDEVECPPGLDPQNTVALVIRGDSMLPFMPEGTVVYYSHRQEGDCTEHLNKLCVVGVHKGPTLLKIVKKGYTKGRYSLLSYNADLIEDVQLDWCAKIVFIKPI